MSSSALSLEPYVAQRTRWPRHGRHVMAQFDDERVVVYQAYRPAIGHFAAAHGYFGGEFSLGRMSWVKPNFLWMMFRSGWGTKEGQEVLASLGCRPPASPAPSAARPGARRARLEVVLAVWLRRAAFDQLLEAAVPSTFWPHRHADHAAWQAAVAGSDVRLQWDPDHGPSGAPVERRAVQLGLRGAALRSYARDWIVRIEDVSAFCREQHARWREGGDGALVLPREDVYPLTAAARAALGTEDA